MTITMTADFTVEPDGLETCKQAVENFIVYIQENEPGTRLYRSYQDQENLHHFFHFFIFEDQAAMEEHRNSEGAVVFADTIKPFLIGELQFHTFSEIGTTEMEV